MKEFVPLLQSLVWPIFILGLVYYGRRSLIAILLAIRLRIEAGDTFEAGSSGIKLTSVRHPGSTTPKTTVDSSTMISEESKFYDAKDESEEEHLVKEKMEENENPGFYIVHKARRDRSLDKGEYEYYRLRIFLEWDPDVDESMVTKIVYYLPDGFDPEVRTITDRDAQFELRTASWGQFNLVADVYLRNREDPLSLERYINF